MPRAIQAQVRSRSPPVIKTWARGGQSSGVGSDVDELIEEAEQSSQKLSNDVDKHNYVVFGGATLSWWRALVKRLTRKAKCTVNWFPPGFELFWIDMPYSTEYLKTLQVRSTLGITYG